MDADISQVMEGETSFRNYRQYETNVCLPDTSEDILQIALQGVLGYIVLQLYKDF